MFWTEVVAMATGSVAVLWVANWWMRREVDEEFAYEEVTV